MSVGPKQSTVRGHREETRGLALVRVAYPSCPENEIHGSYRDRRHAGRPCWTSFTFLERLVRGILRMLWVISRLRFSSKNLRRPRVSLIEVIPSQRVVVCDGLVGAPLQG